MTIITIGEAVALLEIERDALDARRFTKAQEARGEGARVARLVEAYDIAIGALKSTTVAA